ncbi:hypothetical protein D9M72_492790 [compost metagenome]
MSAIDQSAEIKRLRAALRLARERIRHFDLDLSCQTMRPKRDHLWDAIDEIDEALNHREPAHA